MVRELNAMPEEHSLKFLRWTFCLKAAFIFQMDNQIVEYEYSLFYPFNFNVCYIASSNS